MVMLAEILITLRNTQQFHGVKHLTFHEGITLSELKMSQEIDNFPLFPEYV
jgi:hypothetical protein